MINSVTSSSPHLYAVGGGSAMPYVSYNPSNPMQGMLRINGTEMEVFDGSSWIKIYAGGASIGLNNSANEAVDWAIKKMSEEKEWLKLAENNKAVKIALENLEKAREQLNITANLAREYETTS